MTKLKGCLPIFYDGYQQPHIKEMPRTNNHLVVKHWNRYVVVALRGAFRERLPLFWSPVAFGVVRFPWEAL
jgi:hypothetical protein